jgi:murein DD-endopeptidase MepM/ murein hydrolase activator NlpD
VVFGFEYFSVFVLMPRMKFKYNPTSLRYERVKISFFNVLINVVAYVSFGVLFFAGLLILQEYIVETPAEKRLRAENAALKQHKVIMAGQLWSNNQQLAELKKEDEALYKKLFESAGPDRQTNGTDARVDILSSDNEQFEVLLAGMQQQTNELHHLSRQSSNYFYKNASVKKEDLTLLFAMPSLAPVQNFEVSKLVSGFGTRVNPFHKGNYHHDGVDIAAARGTAVMATGHGQVTLAKRSDLVAGYGNYIEIDHGRGIVTRYSHLEDIFVRPGQRVKKGQPVATVGSSGGSIAPHLHYEVMKDGHNIDPVKFFIENLNADQFKELYTRSRKKNQSLD